MFDWDDVFDFVEADVPSQDLDFLAGWHAGEGPSLGYGDDGIVVIGTPYHDMQFYDHQDGDYTCAISSQKMILSQFGIEVSESDLVIKATNNEWFREGVGTYPEDCTKLLESYGVAMHRVDNGSIQDLMSEIQQGHKIIVSVDGSELTDADTSLHELLNRSDTANHAIVITGFTLNSGGEALVHINDPGVPDGAGKTILLSDFKAAWEDSNNQYFATDNAPSDLAEHPVFGEFFNADTGMYMDTEFWKKLGFGVLKFGAIGAGAFAIGQGVKQTSDQVDAESTQTEISTNVAESFDDDQRNALLRAI